jgi:hypothetical protein
VVAVAVVAVAASRWRRAVNWLGCVNPWRGGGAATTQLCAPATNTRREARHTMVMLQRCSVATSVILGMGVRHTFVLVPASHQLVAS